MKHSVVVPVHNEEETLEALYLKIREAMGTAGGGWEMIFVDDASSDRSAEILRRLREENPELSVVRLRNRVGMAAALQAGFDKASGEILITLDGDLQNDPRDIPRLLSKLDEGYDLVCGWRKERSDPLSKKIASKLANGIRRIATREKIHDVGCTLRAFRRETVQNIRLSGGFHRFFTALVARQGFRVAEIPVSHFTRKYGRSKFGLWGRFFQGTVDLIRFHLTHGKNMAGNPAGRAAEKTVNL